MKTPEGDKVLSVIRTRIGRDQAIHAMEIAHQLGWPASRERLVRQIVSSESCLWPNILVCATPGTNGGFFCAETYEEAATYENWLGQAYLNAKDKFEAFRAQARKVGIILPDSTSHQEEAA